MRKKTQIGVNLKNLTVVSSTIFRIDFDVWVGAERIKAISGGGAIDGYDYIIVSDPTGLAREFEFDFSKLKKEIISTSVINIVIRFMDVDGHVSEWGLSKNYAVESGLPYVSNARISQRQDGSGLVDIYYDYDSPHEIDPAQVIVQISSDWGKTWTVPTTSAVGDVGFGVAVGPNRRITWNPATDLSSAGVVPLSASIVLYNSYSVTAIGQRLTGTIMASTVERADVVVSVVSGSEKQRYAVRTGNVGKVIPTEFDPIEV